VAEGKDLKRRLMVIAKYDALGSGSVADENSSSDKLAMKAFDIQCDVMLQE
jgi:hypothetical protein